MNRKASTALKDNLIFLILLILFIVPLGIFIRSQMNGAAIWSDYYAKELTRVINLAEPGDEISLDVQKATEIALSNKVKSISEIFSFDNTNNELCVKLTRGKKSCYFYFNEVDVINYEIKRKSQGNTLEFQIKEAIKS